MKYMTVINTDDYKDFKFFEDTDGKYLVARDAGAKSDEWIALHFTEVESEIRNDGRNFAKSKQLQTTD